MRNAIVVDLDRCIGCFGCEISCKMENNVALGEYWNKVIIEGPHGTFPDVEEYWLPTMCQQCENSPCTHVCPTGASYRNEDGVVLIDKSVCIGCKYCMMACPYGVRNWNKEQRVVEKCTLCQHLTSQGKEPACVHNCPGEARFYGDLDDPTSDAARAIAEAPEGDVHHLKNVGNNPSTAYILSSRFGTWRNGD